MAADRFDKIDVDVRLWLDPGGGITLKAADPQGDPVELSAAQARRLAEALLKLVALDQA